MTPEENIEVVRRICDANRSGPPEATVEIALMLVDPSVEFRSRLTAVDGSTYRGHDGVRRYFADLSDAWQEWSNDVGEIRAVGQDAVMTDVTFSATGKSGVEVELGSVAVWVLSGGKVVQLHAYSTPEEALEAAGLSE